GDEALPPERARITGLEAEDDRRVRLGERARRDRALVRRVVPDALERNADAQVGDGKGVRREVGVEVPERLAVDRHRVADDAARLSPEGVPQPRGGVVLE